MNVFGPSVLLNGRFLFALRRERLLSSPWRSVPWACLGLQTFDILYFNRETPQFDLWDPQKRIYRIHWLGVPPLKSTHPFPSFPISSGHLIEVRGLSAARATLLTGAELHGGALAANASACGGGTGAVGSLVPWAVGDWKSLQVQSRV